jgi:predicted metal-dependent hydrolase
LTDQKRINIDAIGNVVLRKSSRAKYLAIRIKPNEGVIVTIPKRVSYKEGEYFVTNKKDWILKHLTKIKKIEDEQILFDENTLFRTKEHQLIISKHDLEKTKIGITNSEIVVEYPSNQDVHSELIQSEIKLGITNALRIEAKKYLPRRVEELSYLFNMPYNRLFLKNLKSRWGSCSVRNNINLNIHLMRLPEDIIDYVILHELVHTIHKNHGKRFWAKLDIVMPSSKILDKQLKKYSPNYF